MIYILCDKTWCTHNGVHRNTNRCWCGSVIIENNKCKAYECKRMYFIRIGELKEGQESENCRYCSNKNCKYYIKGEM